MANPFLEKVMEKLTPHGPIRSRAMFGGYGIYYGDLMFACIVEGELYFRIGESNKKDYEKHGSKSFTYDGGKRPVVMPYMTLPEEIFENPLQLKKWIEKASEASLLSRKKRK